MRLYDVDVMELAQYVADYLRYEDNVVDNDVDDIACAIELYQEDRLQ